MGEGRRLRRPFWREGGSCEVGTCGMSVGRVIVGFFILVRATRIEEVFFKADKNGGRSEQRGSF